MIFESDVQSIDNCRMDRRAFTKLCHLLETQGRLKASKNMGTEEMVASSLHIIAHRTKNRVLKRQIVRFGETVSRQFHAVLKYVLRLQSLLFKKPEPIPEDSIDNRWRWFRGCLGALDGTYIRVNVKLIDRPRYRSRKNEIATNVLGVCTMDMQFIYVVPRWESFTADGKVLRDAISMRNGLKISQARNCIERCFGVLKPRWAILREKSFYPVKTQCRIISTCCLLHNFIRFEMTIDSIEQNIDDTSTSQPIEEVEEQELIRTCETSTAWAEWRNKLAEEIFNS
ncbi:hypothetical protein DITRI_Ditri19aG0201100 [Diplodiscus trichospermus]